MANVLYLENEGLGKLLGFGFVEKAHILLMIH